MNRREFLRSVAAGAAAATFGPDLAGGSSRSGVRRERPPNILVIMTDDHNASIAGCYGNGLVRTPSLDRLAAGGVTFDTAYTNSPLCGPARLGFTAGKYASRVGVWNNTFWLPSADYPSLPRIMNAAGYESFLCGKQHYDVTRRYGFTEIGGNMNTYFKRGIGSRRRADDTTVDPFKRDQRFAQFRTGENSSVMESDRRVTAGATEFLRRRKGTDRPFFLFTGYVAPHPPLTVPRQYWEHYRGRVPMPVLPPGHVESQPLNYHHLRRGFGVVQTDPDLVRKGRELYYGLTEWVDNEIGKVLEALARSAVAQSTVVIYCSDQGQNMGEHALWWKSCMYEDAVRIPLIINWPERWPGGQRRGGACSLVDVVQTIAELGRAEVPDDWNGDSLCTWLDQPDARWKDVAVSEYYGSYIASGFAMLGTGPYKYVYHTPPDAEHPAERELYDLAKDPGEFTNLAGRAKHVERLRQMHAELVKEVGEDPDETEQRCRADLARGYARKRLT